MGCCGTKEQRRQELATKELREATQGTDILALSTALEQAKKVGVAQELIEAGVQRRQELPKVLLPLAMERLRRRSSAVSSACTAPASTGAAALFPMLIAMLVMPFSIFKAQGRIFKSTKKWREEALAKQWLVEYDESSGKVVIFVSHT